MKTGSVDPYFWLFSWQRGVQKLEWDLEIYQLKVSCLHSAKFFVLFHF